MYYRVLPEDFFTGHWLLASSGTAALSVLYTLLVTVVDFKNIEFQLSYILIKTIKKTFIYFILPLICKGLQHTIMYRNIKNHEFRKDVEICVGGPVTGLSLSVHQRDPPSYLAIVSRL